MLSPPILHATIIAVIENQARQYTVPDLCSRFQFRNTPVRFRRSGNMTSQICSQTGALSDCKPAVFNGKATWYASNPLTAKTDGIITYATPFIVFKVKPGKLSAIQKIQPTPTDKKPGTATKYRIRAYRITNGKKIYGPYSSVRTVK